MNSEEIMDIEDQIIELAIETVTEGWVQGFLYEYENGEYSGSCMYGAICRSIKELILDVEERKQTERVVVSRVEKVIEEFLPRDLTIEMMHMARFNDAPETTKEDVIQTFKEALYRGDNNQ